MEKPEINPEARRGIGHIKEVCDRRKPLLVSLTITYNHEKYLREALEGIVTQKTDFPFVAIVHDDASTDGTAKVLREYAEKYPDIILPIYEKENQYSQGGGKVGKIIRAAREATGAKYVALCEGDDYWTDPYKLQKQVSFLESHPDYSMCFHNAVVHHEDGVAADRLFAMLDTREYESRDNIDHWIVPTASLVLRRKVYGSPSFKQYLQSKKIMVGDYPLIQTCFKEGRVYGFGDVMSVYRLQPGGWTQQKNLSSKLALKLIEQELEYRRIFGGYHNLYAPKAIARHSRAALSLFFKGRMAEAFKIWGVALRHAPWQTIKANVKFAGHMIANKQKR